MKDRWLNFKLSLRHLGLRGTAVLWRHKLHRRLSTREKLCKLHSPEALYPLYARLQASDLFVFHQVFVEREYACLDDRTGVDLVIDCGANVGYSSAYFLSRFPSCHLVAVEPDPDNFRVLAQNLRPYGGRARAVYSGVWSHPAGLVLVEESYRDGTSWSRQVREARPGEKPAVTAVDVDTLLRESSRERISILKVDIEGAEAVVFGRNTEPWIDRVDNMVIELHDDSVFGRGSDVFHQAIAGRGFDVSTAGELTVCKGRR